MSSLELWMLSAATGQAQDGSAALGTTLAGALAPTAVWVRATAGTVPENSASSAAIGTLPPLRMMLRERWSLRQLSRPKVLAPSSWVDCASGAGGAAHDQMVDDGFLVAVS
jgi:hypothetical protein